MLTEETWKHISQRSSNSSLQFSVTSGEGLALPLNNTALQQSAILKTLHSYCYWCPLEQLKQCCPVWDIVCGVRFLAPGIW